jgi:hypothetical protein
LQLTLNATTAIAATDDSTVINGAKSKATGPGRVVYEISRLNAFDDERLPIALMAAGAIAVVAVVWYLYRRDAVELSRPKRVGIMLLRFIALAGLFVFFLGIERRRTAEVVTNSQVAVLVDVSQSMGLGNTNEPTSGPGGSRIDAVVSALSESPLIEDLRRVHDVNIARFDEDVENVVTLRKLGQPSADDPLESSDEPRLTTKAADKPEADVGQIDWTIELQPVGTQTRLGEALAEELRRYGNAPLAGVVLITDGAQNAGIEPDSALETAREAKVPIYTVGLGSTVSSRNVALRDIVVPARAFPGDTLNVTGYLQADGYKGASVDVELVRRKSDEPAGGGTPVASERVALGANGDAVPVSFDLEPTEAGTFVYQLRIKAPADDVNPRDNGREAEVEVVNRQTRVLLFAGGPMRDYQYLRNQLFRDKTMTVDVLLQTAQPGISQESNELLAKFPDTAEDLYKYDCIVAFDPDWTLLDATQVELLEKWVSEEAGGLITIAGPIKTAKWIRSAEHAKIRNLYPVTFQQQLKLIDNGQYGGDTPWPLAMERAGREAKFLWLGNTGEESASAWEGFPGVYGYYGVKGEKPGATVYARFSDPETGRLDERPVYMAGQFYGGGQVFYIGSGEMWRLRGVDPKYFEVLYTKLIRHVSQGRILRGSSRGALLVERDRFELGETVVLRARLSNAQHEPLEEESVTAQLLRPDGTTEPVKLTQEIDRPGMYAGQATVLQEGTYQIALPLPGSNEEPLNKYVQVRVPDLERTRAERNEPLLASLAKETGGIYYEQLESAIHGDESIRPLSEAIASRAEIELVKGAPDKNFKRAQMNWLLSIIAGSLFIEWIVRRLNRLA